MLGSLVNRIADKSTLKIQLHNGTTVQKLLNFTADSRGGHACSGRRESRDELSVLQTYLRTLNSDYDQEASYPAAPGTALGGTR